MNAPTPPPTDAPRRTRFEEVMARTMFVLSLLFLAVLAVLLHRHQPPLEDDLTPAAGLSERVSQTEFWVLVVMLDVLWVVFIVEAWLRFFFHRGIGSWKGRLASTVLICLVPPWRLVARSPGPSGEYWFPFLGWRKPGKPLRQTMERVFGVPMIAIALLVVPVLLIEFVWHEAVEQHLGLALGLEVANSLIWFAFALEFLVMISLHEKKLAYAIRHWIDLVIILLPFVQFLPLLRALRLGQVLRLQYLSRAGRLYRMQGLLLKAWRAFLLLRVIQLILGQNPKRRLKQLEELLEAKLEEVEELRTEIADLKRRIAEESPPPSEKEAARNEPARVG